jgi:hypothetical protein
LNADQGPSLPNQCLLGAILSAMAAMVEDSTAGKRTAT